MSNSTLREALEQLIACHNEPECPAIAVAQAALDADDAARGTMPATYEAVEQTIVGRYRVEKRSGGGFWPYCVQAGDGTMEIFIGHKSQCEKVAAALQAACLDGAYMASRAAAPQAGLTDAEVAAAIAEMASAPQEFDIYLDEEASALLRDTIGEGDAPAIRIQFGNGHSGPGLYVSLAEHPEEGSIKLWDSPIAAAPQSVEPVAWVCATEDDPRRAIYWQADRPKFNSIDGEPFISKTALYLAPPVAPTDAEWPPTEQLVRIALAAWADHQQACRFTTVEGSLTKVCEALRAHIATRPLPAPPTKKEQP